MFFIRDWSLFMVEGGEGGEGRGGGDTEEKMIG